MDVIADKYNYTQNKCAVTLHNMHGYTLHNPCHCTLLSCLPSLYMHVNKMVSSMHDIKPHGMLSDHAHTKFILYCMQFHSKWSTKDGPLCNDFYSITYLCFYVHIICYYYSYTIICTILLTITVFLCLSSFVHTSCMFIKCYAGWRKKKS